MKLFAVMAAVLSLALPAAALAQSAFELMPAPAANRDRIVTVDGARTFTEAHGWYTLTMDADTTFSVDGSVRFFTYAPNGDYVKVGISALPATTRSTFSFDDVQNNMDFFRDPANGSTPAYVLENIVAPENHVLLLGDGNGKKPASMAVWTGKLKNEPNAVPVVVMANLLPQGDLIIFVDASTPEAGEAIIRKHFRFAAGVLE